MQKINGWSEQGNTIVSTSGLPSTTVVQGSFPEATVTVFVAGTITIANIYSDDNATPTPLGNPFTASITGQWGFFAPNGRYDIEFSGGGLLAPFTLRAISLFDENSLWVDVTASPYFAKGDGATDDTAAIQAAINSLSATGGLVLFPYTHDGYSISATLTIPGSNIHLLGIGQVQIINATNALVHDAMIKANFNGLSQAENIVIENLHLVGGSNVNSCFKRGVIFDNVTRSAVRKCHITGVDTNASGGGDCYGINFRDLVTNSEITDNVMEFVGGAVTDTAYKIGVLLQSPLVDAENGVVSGLSPLPQTTVNINVSGNTVLNGTHNYNTQNVADVRFENNYANGGGHRNCIITITNKNISIVGNTFLNAGSTNIILAFGGENLLVSDNICDTNLGGEGIGIEAYYENTNVNLVNNTILGFQTAGILVGYSAVNFLISNNNIIQVGAQDVVGISVIGALGPSYPTPLPAPLIDRITIVDNQIYTAVATTVSSGIRILSKDAGSVLDPVNMTNILVDSNKITYLGAYGVFFSKNGGTGVFTPTVGNNNVLTGTGFFDGPFGSDYPVYRVERRSAVPSSGQWAVGSLVYNTVPAIGTQVGWVNVVAGNPGTWIAFGTPIQGQTYVVTWSQPNNPQPALGNGTLEGLWTQTGTMIFIQIRIVMGTTTTFGNNTSGYRFSLPLAIGTLISQQAGVAYITDASSGSVITTHAVQAATGESTIVLFDMLGGTVRSTSPIVFATGDSIQIALAYDTTT